MPQHSQPLDISVKAFVDDTAPLNAEGTVVCHEHWVRARLLTSRTVTNPGREFYVCSKRHDDLEKCNFFIWADDRNLLSAMQSRLSASSAGLQSPESTPEHASQARRAQMARSSAEPILQKRPRTLSPPPAPANGAPMTPKHRRIEGSDGTWTRPLTPALTPSQRAARHAEIERGLAEAQKLARLASIQEALSAVQTQRSSKDTVSSDTPSSNSAHYPAQDFPSEYSRLAIIEAALQDSRQQRSDVLPSPSSASRNQALPMALPRPPPPSQSDAGYSISSEIEEADLEDMEDKAIQTDPCDDEESILADFLNPSPTASVLGLPVVYPTSLGCRSASARIGSGPSRASVSRVPDSEHGSESWMPASPGPLLTPERGRSTRARTSGGNVGGGMLLTPPGTSQTDWQPASQVGHGPYSRQYGADAAAPQSPTLRTKGKGRELPRCASASTSLSGGSQWQMVQDDDLENPFHDRATAPGGPESPTSSISGADSFGSGLFSRPLSADVIESQIAMLANIPEYVRRLERRERAALSSADIKSRRIAQLEEEVQRLWNDKRALEETISALQVRR